MSTKPRKPREIIEPADALQMLKSAVSYLMQSGLRVQAGTVNGDTLVIRVTGAKSANLGDGIDFVPSEKVATAQGNVPSEIPVQIHDGTPPVPSNVPSEKTTADQADVPSEKVATSSP